MRIILRYLAVTVFCALALRGGAAAAADRLDRGACPVIAAAAVRTGDWDRAERMAARFSAAESDRVESARLAGWVAARRRKASMEKEKIACADPPPAGSFEDPLGLFLASDQAPASSAPARSLLESAHSGTPPGGEAGSGPLREVPSSRD